MHASLWLRLHLAPDAQLRHGIGWGTVAVLADEPRVEDGPGWWAARAAIETVKRDAAKPATRPAAHGLPTGPEDTDGPDPDAVNAALMLSGPDGWLCLGAVAAAAPWDCSTGGTQAELADGRGHLGLGGLAAGPPRRAGRDRRGRRAAEGGHMSWIAVLLIGVAVADLAHSIRPVPIVNECTGAAVAVWVGLLAGLTEPATSSRSLVIAVAGRALGTDRHPGVPAGRGPAWVPLLVLGGSLLLAVLVLGAGPGPAGGLVGDWLDAVQVPVLQGLSADRALLLLGVFLVQLSTGNVLVRLVLAATDTINPAVHDTAEDPEQQLKGGRLLGPMERVLHPRPRAGRPARPPPAS